MPAILAGLIPFIMGAVNWALKQAFSIALGKIAIFVTIQVVMWGLSRLVTDGEGFIGPFEIIGDMANLFDNLEAVLDSFPTVIWALNYFHVPYGVNLYLSALVSSWLMGVIVKAAAK